MSAQWLQHARTTFLDLLFPPRCQGCGRAGAWFCTNCVTALKRIQPPICARCGQPISGRSDCGACRRNPLPTWLNGLRAVADHEGAMRRAIHALKYERVTAIAEPLGGVLADYLTQHPLPVTLLVPVPLHIERQRERGYNQSVLLAQALSRRLGYAVNTTALVRERHTKPQVGLNEGERRQNLLGAFRCAQRLDGARVLLIDDVCTTGSTMVECAAALRDAGAETIWGLTLAR